MLCGQVRQGGNGEKSEDWDGAGKGVVVEKSAENMMLDEKGQIAVKWWLSHFGGVIMS